MMVKSLFIRRLRYCLAVLAIGASTTAMGEPAPTPVRPPLASTCDLIADAARAHDLPVAFFTRLIWQESSFRPNVVSPAGARGIAQFMPATAAERGLVDPFERRDALRESAAFLAELRGTFGNFGLAAAAYNAGPGRVSRWLEDEAVDLPQETKAYVAAVTGRSVTAWRSPRTQLLEPEPTFSCARYAELARTRPAETSPASPSSPGGKAWAVILVGNPFRDKAFAEYQIVRAQYSKILGGSQPTIIHRRIEGSRIVRYIVQIEHDTRAGADMLCSKLKRAGGNCFILANRS